MTTTTTPTTSASKAATIRALLDQAEGESRLGNHEAAKAFSAKAQALMSKYGVDEAMIAAARPITEREGIVHRKVDLGTAGPYSRTRLTLWHVVSKANGCKSVYLGPNYWNADGEPFADRKRHAMISVTGFESDVDRAVMLYTSLTFQAGAEMDAAYPAGQFVGGEGVKWRNAFLIGYSTEIGRRLREATAAARAEFVAERVDARALPEAEVAPAVVAERENVALVLRARDEEVDTAYKTKWPRLGNLSASTAGANRSGRDAGRAAAARANIGGSSGLGSGARGALGR